METFSPSESSITLNKLCAAAAAAAAAGYLSSNASFFRRKNNNTQQCARKTPTIGLGGQGCKEGQVSHIFHTESPLLMKDNSVQLPPSDSTLLRQRWSIPELVSSRGRGQNETLISPRCRIPIREGIDEVHVSAASVRFKLLLIYCCSRTILFISG